MTQKKPKRKQEKSRALTVAGAKVDAVTGEAETASLRGTSKTKGLFSQPLDLTDIVWGVRREPGLFRVTYGVALDVWDNWFTVKNTDDEADETFNKNVQRKLEDLKAKSYLIQLTALERLFGWAILVLGAEDSAEQLDEELRGAAKISDLEVYAGDYHITDVQEDSAGMPEVYKIGGEKAGLKEIHFSRVCHAATRLFLHRYKGLSIAELIYDDSVSLRYIRWAAALAMIRMGGGVPHVTYKGADKTKINAFINTQPFDNLNQLKYFVSDEDKTLEFKGIGNNALDPTRYQTPSRESISTGTGIPEPMLRGAQAGALTGSEVNERAYFKMISDQQTLFEPVLKRLIDKAIGGEGGKLPNYKIAWVPAFEVTEREQAEVDLMRSEIAKNMTTIMQVNEVRKKVYDLKEIPGGDVILGIRGQEQPSSFQPSLPGIDAVSEVEKNLTIELKRIFEKVRANDMDREEGLLAVSLILDEHINRMKQTVKSKLEVRIGKPIGDLSPEQEHYFIGLKKRYMQDFKRILEDAGL
jgi:hypothetical protein